MKKIWFDEAWSDYLYWQGQDTRHQQVRCVVPIKRINALIQDIERNGFDKGIGKPEPLKENLTGFWSRRIDEEHRLVYAVEDERVIIFACRGHDDD